ncbi:glycosyltransferase family 2 protein [Paenibacillus koleovorans]|uniref:glycosyltransferase family 2 protein n=1 Tax=Paenibacillus koleovorans TaxID=121608 RepID=UPI0013E33691|nr:glycosyltransferase family 2 protein [Paenibacillus koleovorans]
MQRERISLCMIVKDEAAHLSRCLRSVWGAVDEIVVVDTGSADETVAIAEDFGARVIHQTWKGDFAIARNTGVERAAGEWILFMDADEELELAHKDALRELVRQPGVEGFFLQIHNYIGRAPRKGGVEAEAVVERSEGATINPVLRLFRNRPGHRFEGRIHEQIAAAICRVTPGAAFQITDVILHHYGYRQEDVLRKDKVKRNMELLQAALADEPDNAFYMYNLGVEFLRLGQAAQARLQFRRAIELVDPYTCSFAHLLYKYEVRSLQALGHGEGAREATLAGLALYPEYTDLWQYRAACEMALGLRLQAKRSLLEALRLGPAPAGYHTEQGIGTYQSAYTLGQLEEEDGELDEAVQWYVETVRMKSSLTPPLCRLFRVMRAMRREEGIVELLAEKFSLSSGEAVWRIVALLLDCRCPAAARLLLFGPLAAGVPSSTKAVAGVLVELFSGEREGEREGEQERGLRAGKGGSQLLERLLEQRDWLDDRPVRYRGAAVAFLRPQLANVGAGLRRAVEQGERAEAEPVWAGLQRLLEGAAAAGASGKLAVVLQRWGAGLAALESRRDRAEGAQALMRSLAALADRRLAVVELEGSEAPIQAARLGLPGFDGF